MGLSVPIWGSRDLQRLSWKHICPFLSCKHFSPFAASDSPRPVSPDLGPRSVFAQPGSVFQRQLSGFRSPHGPWLSGLRGVPTLNHLEDAAKSLFAGTFLSFP